MRLLLFAVALAAPLSSAAQTLLEDHARAAALVSYMSAYVGETLLACATASVLTEKQAEARFSGYRQRNAPVLDRAAEWRKGAERRLGDQGLAADARVRAEDAELTAMAAASAHVQGAIGQARDVPAFCAARIKAIEDGRLDMSGNAELRQLLAK